MSVEQIVFYVLAVGTVLGALAVIVPPFGRNPLHAAVALLATFSLLAGLFVMLSAHLLAILQILVYAGAVMVLFVFVIMLLNLRREDLGGFRVTPWKILGAAAGFLVAIRVSMLAGASVAGATAPDLAQGGLEGFGGVHEVAMSLTTRFFLPFEATSILLLVAIIGALVVARREGGAR